VQLGEAAGLWLRSVLDKAAKAQARPPRQRAAA